MRSIVFRLLVSSGALSVAAASATAQLGRQQGLIEPNVAADSTMTKLPGVTPALAQTLKAARPILSVIAYDSLLGAGGIAKAQRTALYAKTFVHVDLNRAPDAEFLLIPGVDNVKLTALKSGRPWKTLEQFRGELGKSMNAAEVARIEQYLFIPIDLNSSAETRVDAAFDAIMDTFASIGVGTTQWKREFKEYRPWTSMEQFDRQIGKYLRADPSQLQRLKRYVIIVPK